MSGGAGSSPSALEIDSELQADAARLTPVGELDIATAPQLEQEVRTLLARSIRRVVIDLSRLTFIDSSALRLFIVLNERATDEGWTLALIRPVGQVRSVFEITGAEETLPFIEEAGGG
ncbi:MAG TPA: STAS domain-containing protein [Solirubrobacteraceae bacterium]|jgi:anti-sigma B factor antagonist|nr:STAS domain-containing protein [Solirubrobacteraceae bacterium]